MMAAALSNPRGRYNPSTDSWIPTNMTAAPPARTYQTAVWTGAEMIVWGGTDTTNVFNSGGRYNPALDTWTPTSLVGTPAARQRHTARLDWKSNVVWGGLDISQRFNTAGVTIR